MGITVVKFSKKKKKKKIFYERFISISSYFTYRDCSTYNVVIHKYINWLTEWPSYSPGFKVLPSPNGLKWCVKSYNILCSAGSSCQKISKLHCWFKSYSNLAEELDFAHWWIFSRKKHWSNWRNKRDSYSFFCHMWLAYKLWWIEISTKKGI